MATMMSFGEGSEACLVCSITIYGSKTMAKCGHFHLVSRTTHRGGPFDCPGSATCTSIAIPVPLLVFCTHSRQRAKGSVVERTCTANNYRGEILGGLMVQLVLRAALAGHVPPYLPVTIDCDNKGVVSHGNTVQRALRDKQPQADADNIEAGGDLPLGGSTPGRLSEVVGLVPGGTDQRDGGSSGQGCASGGDRNRGIH